MGLRDLHIIAFFLNLHFSKHKIRFCFGPGVVLYLNNMKGRVMLNN